MTKKNYWKLIIIIIIITIFVAFILINQRQKDNDLPKERQAIIAELEDRLNSTKNIIDQREDVLEEDELQLMLNNYQEIEDKLNNLKAEELTSNKFILNSQEVVSQIDNLEVLVIGDLEVNFIPKEGIEAQKIELVDRNDYTVYQLTINELREWLEDNWYVFPQPPEVGGREVSIDNFGFFDRFASVSPDNEKLIFSVHDYAAATSKTFVILADIEDESLSLLNEPLRGNIDSFHFTDDGRLVAFTLSTARAAGDFLSVIDVSQMNKKFILSEEDLLEIMDPEEEMVELGQFMPQFRDLKWYNFNLEFRTNSIENDEDKVWLINSDGSNLRNK